MQRGFAHLVRSLDRIEAASSVPSSDANRDFGYVPLPPPTVLAASGAPCDAGAAQPDAEAPHIEESLPTLQDDAEVWLAALALLRFGEMLDVGSGNDGGCPLSFGSNTLFDATNSDGPGIPRFVPATWDVG